MVIFINKIQYVMVWAGSFVIGNIWLQALLLRLLFSLFLFLIRVIGWFWGVALVGAEVVILDVTYSGGLVSWVRKPPQEVALSDPNVSNYQDPLALSANKLEEEFHGMNINANFQPPVERQASSLGLFGRICKKIYNWFFPSTVDWVSSSAKFRSSLYKNSSNSTLDSFFVNYPSITYVGSDAAKVASNKVVSVCEMSSSVKDISPVSNINSSSNNSLDPFFIDGKFVHDCLYDYLPPLDDAAFKAWTKQKIEPYWSYPRDVFSTDQRIQTMLNCISKLENKAYGPEKEFLKAFSKQLDTCEQTMDVQKSIWLTYELDEFIKFYFLTAECDIFKFWEFAESSKLSVDANTCEKELSQKFRDYDEKLSGFRAYLFEYLYERYDQLVEAKLQGLVSIQSYNKRVGYIHYILLKVVPK